MPNDAVLLLIDMQKGFDDVSQWGVRNNPDLERNNQQLLELWRATGRPVIFVRHDSRSAQSPLWPGQVGNEIKDEVRPLEHEPVVGKNVNSAFIGTSLEADLRARGLNTLVITGIRTDHCVSTAARMAGNLGFETFVISDATATFDTRGPDGILYKADEVSALNLASLHYEFATVIDTATALRMASAQHQISSAAAAAGKR
ncbi:MAG: cysteine hydrolase [Chthoniobacterales bacterium]|nr:cysteine hydrolase [Chthoniobacterales bacterium]